MTHAIISLTGKQFTVKEGTTFKVDSIDNIENIKVLGYSSDSSVFEFGAPFLENITVTLEKLDDRLDDKLRVARFRAKSRYRKNKSHRQPISIVKVISISKKGEEK
ncbi:50S ribosomal protein L21 [bacterium]|jgi:large subunit ribosomal protein L21|nr:50S ribosomal protein L21 [bacterium]NBO36506.1 50S ribosomal protein L21 [bacterium]